MNGVRFIATVLACACPMVLTEVIGWERLATAEKPNTLLGTARSTKSANQSFARLPIPPGSNGRKSIAPAVRGQETRGVQKSSVLDLVGSKAIGRKAHRRAKVNQKSLSKIRVSSQTDLAHHGILEGPQRYDPRPNYRTAGVRNPRTRDVVHDHFQELDRNQDGRIDPMERVFGRLDIDRDLAGRHF